MIGKGSSGPQALTTKTETDALCLPDPSPAVAFALQRLGWHSVAAEKLLAEAAAEDAALAARPTR